VTLCLEQVAQEVEAARQEHQRLAGQRETVTQSIRAIGHAYHFVDVERGVRRNGKLIARAESSETRLPGKPFHAFLTVWLGQGLASLGFSRGKPVFARAFQGSVSHGGSVGCVYFVYVLFL
jgi:hypothetical protein